LRRYAEALGGELEIVAHFPEGDVPEIERAVATVVGSRDYTLQRSADAHAGRKLFLNYVGAAGTGDRIEIDLNYLHRIPIDEVETRELWQPGDVGRPAFRVVGIQELWIGKICALLDRVAPRDAFDTRLLPEDLRTSRRFRSLFVAMAGTLEPVRAAPPRDRGPTATRAPGSRARRWALGGRYPDSRRRAGR